MPYLIRETNDRSANITAHVVNLTTGRLRCGARPTGMDNTVYVSDFDDGAEIATSNYLCRNCLQLVKLDLRKLALDVELMVAAMCEEEERDMRNY